MEKQLLFVIALATFGNIQAQTQPTGTPAAAAQKKQEKMISRFLATNGTAGLLKPTAISQRLIASSNQDVLFEESDTLRLHYSGVRGSVFNVNTLQYTIDYADFNDLLGEAVIHFPAGQQELAPDSTFYRFNQNDEEVYRFFYNQNNLKDSARHNINPSQGVKYYYKYDSEQYLTEVMGGAMVDPAEHRKITYNATHTKVLGDTTFLDYGFPGAPDLRVNEYIYGANDKIDTLAVYEIGDDFVDLRQRYTLTYNSEDQVETIVTLSLEGLGTHSIDSFVYFPGTDIIRESYFEDYNETWANTKMTTRTLGANGLPDTVIYYGRATPQFPWTVMWKHVIEYNNDDNPVLVHKYDNSTYEDTPFGTVRYYYEEYDDNPISVKEVITGDAAVTVYPNPFANTLFIEWNGAGPAGSTELSLYNLLGQKIFNTSVTLVDGNNNINLPPDLNAGSYLLLLSDKEQVIARKKIVKQ